MDSFCLFEHMRGWACIYNPRCLLSRGCLVAGITPLFGLVPVPGLLVVGGGLPSALSAAFYWRGGLMRASLREEVGGVISAY
jgi:hypothetical protein